MVRYSFIFLIVFIIGLLLGSSTQITTSVVPGWHTTIYSPLFFVSAFQCLWLGISAAIYYITERKGRVVHARFFLVHVFLSLFYFMDSSYFYADNYSIERVLMLLPYILFLLGQVIFIVGVLKAKKLAS